LTSSLENTDLALINITLSSSVVFGTAIISFGIFGVLLQIIYRIKYKYHEKIVISKNNFRQGLLLVMYFLLISLFYILNRDSTDLIIISIITPFSLYKYCLKCNEYFIKLEDKVIFLRNNYTLYEVEQVCIDESSYKFICMDENNKTEIIDFNFKVLMKKNVMNKVETVANLLKISASA
jgi:uncharacterized protein with PQ loop repeat